MTSTGLLLVMSDESKGRGVKGNELQWEGGCERRKKKCMSRKEG